MLIGLQVGSLDDLSQWLSCEDNTVNIFLIIIIIMLFWLVQKYTKTVYIFVKWKWQCSFLCFMRKVISK